MPKTTKTLGTNGYVRIKSEPLTYERHSPHSFFLDAASSRLRHDAASQARLDRHQREMQVEMAVRDAGVSRELRAQGVEMRVNPNTTLGQGGELSPPLWLIDDAHVKTAARAGRTFADLLPNEVLPAGVSSIYVPKIALGSSDTIQTAQGDPDADADLTSTSISQPQIVTFAGQTEVSQQLLDMSPHGFDRWAYLDLAADYNAQLENDLINGSGVSGQMLGLANFTIPASNTIAGSSATTIALLWPLLGQAAAAVANNRLLQPEVWLMAGRRWFWIVSSIDSSNRPIASPHSGSDAAHWPVAGGYPPVGNIDGLPTYLSGAITAGAVADNAYCVRPNDMFLFESQERYDVVPSPVSGTLQVRLRLHRYAAFVGNIYTSGLGVVAAIPKPASF